MAIRAPEALVGDERAESECAAQVGDADVEFGELSLEPPATDRAMPSATLSHYIRSAIDRGQHSLGAADLAIPRSHFDPSHASFAERPPPSPTVHGRRFRSVVGRDSIAES